MTGAEGESSSPALRSDGARSEWPLGILILLGVMYFAEPLLLGQTFYYRDLYSHFLPVKQTLISLISGGDWPLWNPYIHGGAPFLSNPNNTVFYPSNILYLVLPLLTAFNLDIGLHLILCSVFAYLLARAVGLARLSAFVAAVIYGYCGYTLSLGNLLNRLLAMPYVPLIALLWHLFLLRGQRRYFVLAVVAGVFQMLAGAPETFLVSLAFVFCWSLCFPYTRTRALGRVGRFAMLVVLIGGISSLQVLPALEMGRESSRAASGKTGDLSTWSLHPKRAPEAIVPGFSGRTDALGAADYWGSPNEDQGFPLILSIYFGLLPIVLAFCGALAPSEKRQELVLFRRFLLVFMLISVVLSFGRFLPGFIAAVTAVPVLSWFRYPIKFMTGAVLPLSLLAGVCFQFLNRSDSTDRDSSSRILWAITTMTAALVGFAAVYLASPSFRTGFQRFFFAASRPDIEAGVRHGLLHAGGICFAAALVLFHRRLRPSAWQPWVFAGIITIDLLAAGRSVNTYAPREFFTREPELAEVIRREIGTGRLYRVPKSEGVSLNAPTNDVIYQYRWNLDVLNGYVAPLYGVPIVYHDDLDRMAASHVRNMSRVVSGIPWEKRIPFLSAGGANLILTDENLSVEGLVPVVKVSTASNTPFYLYRNKTAADPVTLVHSWKSVSTEDEALGEMLSPGFDPRSQVVLLRTASPPPASPCGSDDQIVTLKALASSSTYRVTSGCDGYLVFAEPLYRGCKVRVDGKERQLIRSNLAFFAVFMEAGEHTVERRYRPRSLTLGLAISMASCVLLVVVAMRMSRP